MPKTLLLADDSVVIQKLVALSFANEDIELVTVYNGDDAIARAREVSPDLVLADVVMPGKNGYEVCEAIKSDPKLAHVPVLLLTGTFEAFDDQRAQQARSDGHITKPFEAQALVERVNGLLAAPRPASAAATAAAPAAAPAADEASSGDVYDFFDDELENSLAGEEAPRADALELDGSDRSAFATPASDDDPLASLADEEPDATVAMMTEEPELPADEVDDLLADASLDDQPTITASRMAAAAPPIDDADLSFDDRDTQPGPPRRPAVSLPEDSFEPIAAPGANANPDPMATVLEDDLDFGDSAPGTGGASDPDRTVLADDLFASGRGREARAATAPTPAADDDLEFGFMTEPPTSLTPPSELDDLELSDADAGTDLLAQAELDPAGRSAFDVSSSDLGDPWAETPAALPDGEALAVEAEPELETDAEPLPEPEPPAGLELETRPAVAAPLPMGEETATPAAARAPAIAPDLSDVLQGRIHETLEKVAWEAFSELSETVVRHVLERVERIAWEVIPQMAETLVREEIRRMKGESESDD